MPLRTYSMGSWMVIIFLSSVLILDKQEYKVVVFPLPVGPVKNMIPCGFLINCSKTFFSSERNPKSSKEYNLEVLRMRSTTHSPNWVGKRETRKSRSTFSYRTLNR